MDNREAVNWLINISADIGKVEHSDLWHYEQALTEIKDMLESAQLSKESTTSDLISRQAVLDAIVQCTNCGDEDTLREYVLKHSLDNGWTGGILEALDAVKDLPTAQPEREEGEWVQIQRCVGDTQPDLECPFCKHRIGWWDMGRYCAGCGAKLEGGAG